MKAYQIKIELKESKPLIWRRVIIPSRITFNRLHGIIQIAMGWLDYHLYKFEFPGGKLRVVCDDEIYGEWKYCRKRYMEEKPTEEDDPSGYLKDMAEMEMKRAHYIKIDKYLKEYGSFDYVYDFGDYWEHRIIFEEVIKDYSQDYPIVIEGEGACPPEDVGGIGGYEEFLEAWNDEKHFDHSRMRMWGEGQLYRPLSIEGINYTMIFALNTNRIGW